MLSQNAGAPDANAGERLRDYLGVRWIEVI
jgi:hypothetical protein